MLRIIDSVNIPVLVTDEAGRIITANRSAVMFFRTDFSKETEITEFFPSVVFRGNSRLLSLKDGETFYFFYIDALVNGVAKEADLDVALLENEGKRLYVCTVKDVTIYSELLNSMDKFSTMVENSPASVLITDTNGIIKFISNNFQHLTGYSYEELIGANIGMFQPDFREKEFRRDILKVMKDGEKWRGELRSISKDGSTCWVIATISPIYDKNNEITNFISVQEDITYLKRIEEELKQSQEKFRVLFETLPEGIVVTDLSGSVIQVNQAFLNIHGFKKRGDVVGRNIYEVAEKNAIELIKSLFEQAEKNGYSEVGNYEVVNGDKLYVELQIALMTGGGGPIGFVILAGNHTIRKKAEIALRESEARNRALIEAVPDIMFRVNNRGVYLDKMLGNKINEVFPESIAVDAVKYISAAIKSKEIQIFEYPVTTSGRNEYYESRFIAIENDEVLIILRNVTEKHNAMMQIEDSRREAELANRSKSEFLANMSHEIRTPLNSITGFIELLMRGQLDADQKEYLGIIKNSASNLLEIINDILDVSKIESNKLELSNIEFDPFSEFESVVRLFSIKAREKRMRLFSFMDPRIPQSVISDPLRIRQVISNLLSNAIKFTPDEGLVMIEIRLLEAGAGRCLINFSVSDTGIGIPEHKQKQIFDAFTQADSSITRRFGGTGLGLNISASLVQLLGSEIVLESVMGVGSRFHFNLEFEVDSLSSPADLIKDRGIRTYIVADKDDQYSLKNLQSYLEACSCKIDLCADFDAACAAGPDLIFIVKPTFRPEDLAEMDIEKTDCPVTVISESSEYNDYSADLKPAFFDVLTHPLTHSTLFKILTGAAGLNKTQHSFAKEVREMGNLRFSGNVLVGEDNLINQKLMRLLLENYGISADIAGNGLTVFEKFKRNRYDLVLMDINMPVADGLETALMIRDYERETNSLAVPIFALTAKALKEDRESVIRNGMNGFLTKPVEMDKLEAVLIEYLPTVMSDAVENSNIKNKVPENDAPESSDDKDDSVYYSVKKIAEELQVPEKVLRVIGLEFFDDALKVIDEIKIAVKLSLYKEVSLLSHKMRGASANLRLIKISHSFQELEEKSSSYDANFDYSAVIDNIINEIEYIKRYF